MNNDNESMSCATGCWLVGALAGLLAAVLLGSQGGWSFFPAILAGIVVAVIAGLLLNWALCRSSTAVEEPMRAAETARPAETARVQETARAETDTARAETETRSAAAATTATAAAAATASAATMSQAPAANSAPAPTAPAAPVIKPSTPLAGEAELASRKGDWSYKADDADKAPPAKAPAKKAAAKKAPAKKAAAKAAPAKKAPAEKAAPKKTAAKSKAAKPAAKAAAKSADAGAGKKPRTLKKARAGGADDLKLIKGVGPKMEDLLHSMGFFHFDQVAGWGPAEVSWVDQNLAGFKGRATRDEWVAQAKILAAGGSTEFSAKKGGAT